MSRHHDTVYRADLIPVDEAISRIPPGSRVYVGSGGSEPRTLLEGLARQADRLGGVELCSLFPLAGLPLDFASGPRHTAFCAGGSLREAVGPTRADIVPVFPSEIPELIRSGQQRIDVALLQLSPPDEAGNCSLGIHVDVQRAALETARLVLAEIHPDMPRTCGQTIVPRSRIDFCVEAQSPLGELPRATAPSETFLEIGMHVARLVESGSCLQLGIGSLHDAIAGFLEERGHLGLHTGTFSDGVLGLLENGNIDNSRKTVLPGRSVASFAIGSRRLLDFLDGNPAVELHPSDFVYDPRVICRNDRVIAVGTATRVDLTGQAAVDDAGPDLAGGGAPADFARGAAMSRGGKPILAIPSTANGGRDSRIVPRLEAGSDVVTRRGDVHYVVTEYGVAHLHGKSMRQRAVALVGIAHPDFRVELLDFVKAKHYVFLEGTALSHALDPYPSEWERRARFGDEEMLVRPLRPADVARLRDFFYSHTMETIYHRYFTVKKHLSHEEARHLCSVDYRQRMAFGVFRGSGETSPLVAVGRYDLNPRTGLAETALVVGEQWRDRGIGSALLRLLLDYARGHGVRGIRADVLPGNQGLLRLHRALGHEVRWENDARVYEVRHVFAGEAAPTTEPIDGPRPDAGGAPGARVA